MNEIILDDKYMTDLREQFKKWAVFLNSIFGIASFTFAIACLGTKTPWLNAWFSLIVVGFIYREKSHIFPKEILRLRMEAKNDEKARVILTGLTTEFLSLWVAITQYPVFLIGYGLLVLIALSPLIGFMSPTVNLIVQAYTGA